MRFKETRLQELNDKLCYYINTFEDYLDKFCRELTDIDEDLVTAIKYSVKNGGKRVRPVLCLATAEMLEVPTDKVLKYALTIELIHAYSLVHDDLPAMDNDDYRRGKLSTHKKFGEAMGILVGDSLLNSATEVALSGNDFSDMDLLATRKIFQLAGARGMISGQVKDLKFEKNKIFNEEILLDIYLKKTCNLLKAAVLTPSILAGNKYYDELENFAYNLGVLFQITDDILDVEGNFETLGKTLNKDAESDKLTCIKLWGLEFAKIQANKHYKECISVIDKMGKNDFLTFFTDKIYSRKN